MAAVFSADGIWKDGGGEGEVFGGVLDHLGVVSETKRVNVSARRNGRRLSEGHVPVFNSRFRLFVFAVCGIAYEKVGAVGGVDKRVAGAGIARENEFKSLAMRAENLLGQKGRAVHRYALTVLKFFP